MKKIILAVFALSAIVAKAQNVGINTNDPKTTLDVQKGSSAFPGLTPPRVTKSDLAGKTYTSAQTGAVAYVTDASGNNNGQTQLINSQGYYYFDGQRWNHLDSKLPQNTYYTTYQLKHVIANNYVDRAPSGRNGGGDVVNLGMEIPITIPANSKVLIRVEYSVPMGFTGTQNMNDVTGYYGVKFLREWQHNNFFEEQPMASRKVLAPANGQTSGYGSVTTVSGKYIEIYDNRGVNNPVDILFRLQGYAEKTSHTTRFNMADSNGGSNWGKAAMTLHSYIEVRN